MFELPEILKGCKIFPCIVGDKKPATENGWQEASDDPAQIAAWYALNPNFNWAVATGLSGLFVIDVDPNGLDWWAKLLERDPVIRAAVERAYQVRTPRGGLHIYFRGEGPSTASRIAEGIDTRGGIYRNGKIVSGGYVLLPGSRTKDGTYSELPGGVIDALPACISAIVPERKKTDTLGLEKNPGKDLPRNIQTAVDILKNRVATGDVAIQGQGGDNKTIVVACAVLDKGISPAVCFDLLWEHWNPHCKPPWDDWELETKVRNAYNSGEDTQTGVKGHQANEDAFAAYAGRITEPPEKKARYQPMWLADARRDVKPASWLIPGFIPSQGTGIIFGLSGSYKTFIALDWALCLAHGVPGQWNAPPVKHTVLFFAGENSYALQQERVDSWCEWQGLNPDDARFVIIRGVPAYGDTQSWQEIRDALAEMKVIPDFIVFDTLTRLMSGMAENSNDDAKIVLAHCENLAEYYDAFVLGIGHTGKDVSKGMRGAQVFIDNSDAVHFLKETIHGTTMKVKKLKEVDKPDDLFYFEKKVFGKSIILERTMTASRDANERKSGSKFSWATQEEVIRVLSGLDGKANDLMLSMTIADAHGIAREEVMTQLNKAEGLTWLRPSKGQWEIPKQEFDL